MYQIIFILPQENDLYSQSPILKRYGNYTNLRSEIKRMACSCLTQIDKSISSQINIIFQDNFHTDFKSCRPTFTAYFSAMSGFEPGIEEKIKQIEFSFPIIYPIVLKGDFNKNLPDTLRKYQGIVYSKFAKHIGDDNKRFENLINEILSNALESFGLAAQRKVFISYSQHEASEVAQQLYRELQKRHYKPFLDVTGLNPAENFQESLMHELADSDILLLLDSGKNRKSKWCRDELHAALYNGMGVLALAWNYDPKDAYWTDFKLLDIESIVPTDFSGSTLNPNKVEDILDSIDKIRIRAKFAKMNNLLQLLKQKSPYENACLVTRNSTCMINPKNKGKCLTTKKYYLPITTVPTAQDFQKASSIKTDLHESVGIVYLNDYLHSTWQNHLDWLESVTSVKTIKIEKPKANGK